MTGFKGQRGESGPTGPQGIYINIVCGIDISVNFDDHDILCSAKHK